MQRINEDLRSGQFKQAYLLYGEEAYLRRQYRDRLKRVFVNEVRYALRAGDFWFTLDEMERANFITRDSVNLLNRQHSETGIRLLYRGRFNVLCRKVDWEW